jgi:hypothetical protein
MEFDVLRQVPAALMGHLTSPSDQTSHPSIKRLEKLI